MEENIQAKGIYQIKNLVNDSVYVGSTFNLGKRWGLHLFDLINEKHYNRFLQEDFNIYGIENFSFQTLEVCNTNNVRELRNKEADWMELVGKEHTLYNIVSIIKKPIIDNFAEFIDYINNKWLVPQEVDNKNIRDYYIYKKKDKREIIKQATKCNVIDKSLNKITFNSVIDLMETSLGYTIDKGRIRTGGRRLSYKIITEYKETNYGSIKTN